jgi:glycosyltransferase involved in cell wall biosynthesis
LGIRQRFRRKISAENDAVTILFTNSWHQASTGFYLRGGLDVLEAYSVIFSKHAPLRLILRSKLPQDLNRRYRQIIERCNVQVIDQFLSEDEYGSAFFQRRYLLPSARLHVVSILQAMASGLAIVVTDGWGMGEYISHGRNGLIVPGRYGSCS